MIVTSSSPTATPSTPAERRALGVVTFLVTFGAFLVFLPFMVPLVLSSWVAILLRPRVVQLTRALAGRSKAAAVITAAVAVSLLAPLVAALVPLVFLVIELVQDVQRSGAWPEAARSVVGDEGRVDVVALAREHMSGALGAATGILRTSASVALALGIFVFGLFVFCVDGGRLVRWFREHAPMKPEHFDRLAAAYAETGRGLVIGTGLTALIQGLLALATYLVVGLPRAIPLGILTMIAALIPGGGTALVWLPVSVLLFLTGHPVKAGIAFVSGAVLIGSVDNVLKPILARRASLRMSSVALFLSMLGGLAAFGAAGLALGPLFVRLAIEALALAREELLVGVGVVPTSDEAASLRPSEIVRPGV